MVRLSRGFNGIVGADERGRGSKSRLRSEQKLGCDEVFGFLGVGVRDVRGGPRQICVKREGVALQLELGAQ